MILGEPARDFSGKIISWVEKQPNGDIIVRDFYVRIQGRYDKNSDTTRDFYGRVIARGDAHGMLIDDADKK